MYIFKCVLSVAFTLFVYAKQLQIHMQARSSIIDYCKYSFTQIFTAEIQFERNPNKTFSAEQIINAQ